MLMQIALIPLPFGGGEGAAEGAGGLLHRAQALAQAHERRDSHSQGNDINILINPLTKYANVPLMMKQRARE